MRIAVIGTISSSMVSFRGPLLKALVDAGHTAYAFAIDYDDQTEARVRQLGAEPLCFRMDRTGTNPLRDLQSTWTLMRLLRRHKIDLVLSYFVKPVIYGSIAAVIAGVERRYSLLPGLGYAFTDSHSGPTIHQRLLAGVLKRMLRFALARNERVFLYNADDIAEVGHLRLVDPKKIERVNGTGIDLDVYISVPAVTDPITFLMAARLIAQKGVREFAAAARMVKKRHPKARFVLLGGVDTNPGGLAESEVQSWVAEGVLQWPGQVPDVRPWLAQASVYVLPSYREGVPRSTQEAMAMARPVITTDSVGCRETVIHGCNGFLVPVRDAEVLAERMMQFIKQPQLIETMGRASRELAEEKFDVHKINAGLLQSMRLV